MTAQNSAISALPERPVLIAYLLIIHVGALLPSKTKPAIVEECKDRSGQVLPRCV